MLNENPFSHLKPEEPKKAIFGQVIPEKHA
jgi:hypothetical protein